MQKEPSFWGGSFLFLVYLLHYIIRNDIITPAATAEPITPETLGAIACMSRWFDGSYF